MTNKTKKQTTKKQTSKKKSNRKQTSKKQTSKKKSYRKQTNIDGLGKSYYKNLNYKYPSDCLRKTVIYKHPSNPKLKAIFPFITNYDEVTKMIYNNILPDDTGLTVKQWINHHNISNSYNEKNKNNKNNSNDNHNHRINLNENIQKEIDFKLNSAVYELISSRTVTNTFNYLFQKISNGIYVQIRDGRISYFIPFVNTNFVNNWGNLIKLPSKYKTLKDYYLDKEKEFNSRSIKYLPNKDLWRASNCLIQTGKLGSINDSYWAEMYNMIESTCSEYKINDVEFYLNLKSFPLLTNNFTEPFDKIYGKNVPLTSYYYPSYHPILSISTNDNFGDLVYPTPEDWKLVTGEFFRNDCSNSFKSEIHQHKPNLDDTILISENSSNDLEWNQKIPIAYFRDDSSGCGTTSKNNTRIKLVTLGNKYPNLLNVAITLLNKRDKYDYELNFHHPSDYKFKMSTDNDLEYGKYKYLISVPGYVMDQKFPYYLSLGALVLKVDSDYKAWYSHLLKPYKHFIPVKSDLSDLISIIKWANTHPELIQKIAKNGKLAFKKFFNRKTILEYWNYLLNSIANRRLNSESLDIEFNKYKTNIKILPHILIPPPDLTVINLSNYKLGIIIPYYSQNKQYEEIRKKLVQHLLEYFRNIKGLKFKIIVIEQIKANTKFNKGQLINLGLLIAKKHECTHIVINNLSFFATPSLMPYYLDFEKANEAPVQIGFDWKAKYKGYYLGTCILWNIKMLENVGGYSNSIWGWGCSDAILYHRYIKYINKNKVKGTILIPISDTQYTKLSEISAIQQHLIDGQYKQLKILTDWFINDYKDLKELDKHLSKAIQLKLRKGKTHENITYNEDNSKFRYDKYLKLIDKHTNQKEIEYYVFKLMNDELIGLQS